jgi:DHA1 family multidrug resistance protein-like MFS transporter
VPQTTQNIRRLLPILGLTVFSSNLGTGIIAPLLPLYAEKLGASGIWLGIIFSGVSIASAIFMPFAGRFSDRRGRKLILCIGLFGLTFTSFGYVWANSIASLTIVRFLQGTASAMVLPISQAYIGDITPEGEEGKWMGIFNATFITGFGFGPLLGGVIADHFGMNAAFYGMGIFNLLSFLGVTVFLPEIVPRRKTAGQFSFRGITASKITRGIFSYQVGASANRGIMTAFLPVFASVYIGLNTAFIGTLLTVSIIGNSLLQVPSGNLADKFNRRYMIILGSLGVAVSMLLIPQAGSFWLLLAIMAVGAIFDACAMPSAMAAIIQEGRKYGMGVATSVSNMGGGLGMGLAPILAGFVVDLLEVKSAFYVSAAIVLISIVVFNQFIRRADVAKI